jgi:hypothetical protein
MDFEYSLDPFQLTTSLCFITRRWSSRPVDKAALVALLWVGEKRNTIVSVPKRITRLLWYPHYQCQMATFFYKNLSNNANFVADIDDDYIAR